MKETRLYEPPSDSAIQLSSHFDYYFSPFDLIFFGGRELRENARGSVRVPSQECIFRETKRDPIGGDCKLLPTFLLFFFLMISFSLKHTKHDGPKIKFHLESVHTHSDAIINRSSLKYTSTTDAYRRPFLSSPSHASA